MVLITFKRVLCSSIGALALLQITIARPLFPTKDDELQERTVSEAALLGREVPQLALLGARSDLSYDRLFERNPPNQHRTGLSGQISKEPKANPFRSKPHSAPAPRAQPAQPQNARKALPNNTKLRLSDAARNELNTMGLHGKDRRKAIKWHKNQVKQQMKTNPNLKGKAVTGVIEHLAHKGGSDMKEKNHITASFHDKNRQQVANSYNGGNLSYLTAQKNHHLYVNSLKGLPQQAKAGWNKNNADIRGQSRTHQTSLSKTATPGKSSTKGKGKQNPERNFSKNPAKGFQKKGRR